MNEDCVSWHETPSMLYDEYIYNGYRPLNRPFSYYAKSLFQKHNETINAWTHYIAAVYMLSFVFRLNFSDP